MANGHKILVRADENSKRPIALENAGNQLLLGFSFASARVSGPITERRKEKLVQSQTSFDTRLAMFLLRFNGKLLSSRKR